MKPRRAVAGIVAGIATIPGALAHCPLCTIGAVAAAGGASYLGVNQAGIGIFIGAFAVSIGWWVSRVLPKQYFRGQRPTLIIFSFITTVMPLMAFLSDVHPVYISLWGGYGSTFNRTYLLNLFFTGSLIGGVITAGTPWLSNRLTILRNGKQIPYQGILLTFILLLVTAGVLQVAL